MKLSTNTVIDIVALAMIFVFVYLKIPTWLVVSIFLFRIVLYGWAAFEILQPKKTNYLHVFGQNRKLLYMMQNTATWNIKEKEIVLNERNQDSSNQEVTITFGETESQKIMGEKWTCAEIVNFEARIMGYQTIFFKEDLFLIVGNNIFVYTNEQSSQELLKKIDQYLDYDWS